MLPPPADGATEEAAAVGGSVFEQAEAPREPSAHEGAESDAEERSSSEEDGEAPATAANFVYAGQAEVEEELARPQLLERIGQLKGLLVCGVFRCTAGSDFRGRRCRGEVVVERGPKELLGCRVHIIGRLNRNRAWHCDRSWVRISRASVGGRAHGTDLNAPWSREHAARTAIYGQIVRAEESQAPRQRQVVCLRSKIVRSRRSMTFRAINGKFPLITVPWEAEIDPPSLFELHVVEVTHWPENLPQGSYVRALKLRDEDSSILRAVQISLNFCDWPLEREAPTAAVKAPAPQLPAGLPRLKAVAIQHPGWPVSMALSVSSEVKPCLEVHVADVNEHLDLYPSGEIEAQLRQRAVGAWFLDHEDRPVRASLPLLPPDLERRACFAKKQPRPAMTFRFPLKPGREVGLEEGRHFPSLVECEEVYSHEDAERLVREGGDARLQELHRVAERLERDAAERGLSLLVEHLEPDFVQGGAEARGCAAAGRIIACCALLANRHAGRELRKLKAWARLAPGEGPDVMPAFVRAQQDPVACRAALQLLYQAKGQVPMEGEELGVKGFVTALRRLLKQPLSVRQRECLQFAFLKQLRQALPPGGYRLVYCQAASDEEGTTLGGRGCRVFHVTAPAQRYMDVLGMRALKLAGGWAPRGAHSTLSRRELLEAAERTNMRHEALVFGQAIFRQISVMRSMEPFGRVVKDAVVSAVNQGGVQVLIPLGGRAGLNLQLPAAALRSASCLVEFLPEVCRLKITSLQGSSPMNATRHHWTIAPWGGTTLGALVSRNFAQPVKHHAALSAVVLSEVTFAAQASASTDRQEVSLSVGHRMFPEVFSCCPDLEQWYRVESDIVAYTEVFHGIRLCQTHAAVAANSVYTPSMASSAQWFARHGRELCQLIVPQDVARYGLHGVTPQDLAVITCVDDEGQRAAVLYGRLESVAPAGKQVKTRRCHVRGCSDAKCPFAHSEEELRGVRLQVDVELSEVSAGAKAAQRDFLERAGRRVRVQFINVPLADRRSLEQLQRLPSFARDTSPVLSYLTGTQAPAQKKKLQERRPLATPQQVARALIGLDFQVKGGHEAALNDVQLRGLKAALQHAFSLVQGPPGTGKTTFLVHLAVALLNLEADETVEEWRPVASGKGRVRQDQMPGRLLIAAPSNYAADEVLARLLRDTTVPHQYVTRVYARSIETAEGSRYKSDAAVHYENHFRVRPALVEHSLHYKTKERPAVKARQRELAPRDQPQNHSVRKQFDEAYEKEEALVLKEARIVVTTCTSACSHSSLVKSTGERCLSFATVVVDEAAQATEVDVLLPALMAEQRVVLVGDHKQLGPVVTQQSLCSAYMGVLGTSMLQRLLEHAGQQTLRPETTMLDVQYRMHRSIRSFPSQQFYDSRLQDAECVAGAEGGMHPSLWPVPGENVVFVDCRHPHALGEVIGVGKGPSRATTTTENNTSLKNDGEARLVALACKRLLRKQGCGAGDVAVVTPYAAQKQEIRELLRQQGMEDIDVGTVHALQGAEREFIVISFVRSSSEGLALCQNAHGSGAGDVVVAPSKRDEAARQISESNLGIVANAQVLNVSITRSRRGLVIVGNRSVLAEGSQDFLDLTEAYKKKGCLLAEADFRNRA